MNDLHQWLDDSIGFVFEEHERERAAQRELTVTYRVAIDREIEPFDEVLLVDDSLAIPGGVFGMAEIVFHARAPAWLVTELDVQGHPGYDDVDELLEDVEPYSPKKLDRSTELDVIAFYPFITEADGEAWEDVYEVIQTWAAAEVANGAMEAAVEAIRDAIDDGDEGEPGGVPIEINDGDGDGGG